MKYYIEEKDEVVKHLYKSICPIKVVQKNGVEMYRHVRQVLCRRSSILYVDNVALYKRIGGCMENKINMSYSIRRRPQWDDLSNLWLKRFIPHIKSPLIGDVDFTSHRNSVVITDQSWSNDILTIASEDVILSDSKEGLCAVSSMNSDYVKTWWIDISIKEGEAFFSKRINEIRSKLKPNMSPAANHQFILDALAFTGKECGLARLAKYLDYCVLRDLLFSKEVTLNTQYKDVFHKKVDYARDNRSSQKEILGEMYLYFNPGKWLFGSNYSLTNSMKELVADAEYLSKSKDKQWSREEIKHVLNDWKSLGGVTDQRLWEDMMVFVSSINAD